EPGGKTVSFLYFTPEKELAPVFPDCDPDIKLRRRPGTDGATAGRPFQGYVGTCLIVPTYRAGSTLTGERPGGLRVLNGGRGDQFHCLRPVFFAIGSPATTAVAKPPRPTRARDMAALSLGWRPDVQLVLLGPGYQLPDLAVEFLARGNLVVEQIH